MVSRIKGLLKVSQYHASHQAPIETHQNFIMQEREKIRLPSGFYEILIDSCTKFPC